MPQNRINIAVLLGDPSGIGPELVSKLLSEEITNQANIVIIGEKNILENGNKISGNSHNLKFVEDFNEINFDDGNKFFLDISKGKNHDYKLSECSKESGESVSLAGSISSPCPISAVKVTTSHSYSSWSHFKITDVSKPPEYAKTTFLTFDIYFPSNVN